jgi:hypothetical protein
MEEHQAPTIDRLVLQVDEELQRRKRPLTMMDAAKHSQLEKSANDQILDAKTATVALFLELESSARTTGLHGYQDFLKIIFEGRRDPRALRAANRCVLNFNYDRLFEFAFADYFRLDSNVDCYGQAWLNSGLDFFDRQDVDVLVDRFCLLKLHGTAGIFVERHYGKSKYRHVGFQRGKITIDDNLFWPANPKSSLYPSERREPLIVFPFEKDRARSGGTSFLFDNYIRAIWGHDMQPGSAEKLMSEATQVWVIGYSFDPNDRKAMMKLLRKSDCDIVVQNRTKEEAETICDELRLQYTGLAQRFRSFGKPF